MDDRPYSMPDAETYLCRTAPYRLANGLITNVPTKNIVDWTEVYLKKNLDSQIWWVQSMAHHVHSDYWEDDAICLEMEIAQIELWRKLFEEHFPQHRFVIDCETLDFVTWYQAFPDAPTADDEYWDLCGDWQIRFRSVEQLQMAVTDFDQFCLLPPPAFFETSSPTARAMEQQQELRDWLSSLSIPDIDARHRGAMFATELSTGKRVLFAVKTTRTVVGPAVAPEVSDHRLLRHLSVN